MPDSEGAIDAELKPSRYQNYTHAELLESLYEVNHRIGEMEQREVERQSDALTDHIRETGTFFITIGFAGYAISLSLPETSFAPLSTIVMITGLALIFAGLIRARRETKRRLDSMLQ